MADGEYGFFKKVEAKDAAFKYGFKHMGLFALEDIKKGEGIFHCNPETCCYLQYYDVNKAKTRVETEELCKQYPKSAEFIKRYSYMMDDDLYDFPQNYKDQQLPEDCMFFNHSCDGNCAFGSDDSGRVIAKRDIKAGEELTYDYQFMDIEASYYDGLQCKCGSHKCRGKLRFDQYRNMDWIKENYKYCNHLLKKRIDELQTKWFSSSCYLKHYNNNTVLGLTALRYIAQDELVALYSDLSNINEESHYLRHSNNPTCYVNNEGEVFAKTNIEAQTELTLDFSK